MLKNAILNNRAVHRVLARLRWVGGRCAMRLFHGLSGVRPRRVFFSSFKGDRYADSPARISEALHTLRPDAEIIWQLRDPRPAPGYVRVVRPRTPAALWAISTARCFVDNFNRPQYMLKFSDQKYVQTWHGERGFKKVLFDMEDGQRFPDGEQMDLAVSGSDFGTRVFRSAFRYPGEVMQRGVPRNDALLCVEKGTIAELRRSLGLEAGQRVLLYAPTFRDGSCGGDQPAGFSLTRALDRLEKATGEPWVCFTRAHSLNSGVAGEGDGRVRDVTEWAETTDLLLVTDLLISDYSSIAGDFALLDRPIILYQADLDAYLADERQTYFDLRTCPYPRAESEEQLMAMLDDTDALVPACARILEFYGVTETGRSAQAVAQWISETLG